MPETLTKADPLRHPLPERSYPGRGIAHGPLWWIAFVTGSFLVVVSGWIPEPWFYIVGLVLPLALMLAYAYLGLKYTTGSDALSQFADSIYYLGFIFTLVTLAVALVSLGTQPSWESIPLQELIGRFGLALSTTILGLAIRVAAVNFSPTEIGLRTDVEQQLATSVESFRASLQVSAESLKSATDTYLGELTKATSASSHAMQEHVETVGGDLEAAVEKLVGSAEQAAVSFSKRFDAKTAEMRFPDEILSDAVGKSLEKITAAIDAMPSVMSKSLAHQREIAYQSQKVSQKYAALEDMISPLSDFVGKLGDVGHTLADMTMKLHSAGAQLGARIDQSAASLVKLDEQLKALTQELHGTVGGFKSIEAASRAFEEHVALAERHRNALEEHLSASRGAVEQVHKELVEAAGAITRRLGNE